MLYVTPLAYVALLGWIPFVMVLFMLLPARKAAATALVGGWLIMPPMTLYFAGMPDYTKTTAATVGIVLGTLIFGLDDLQRFRLRWFDLPAFIYCFSGIVSSLQNGLGFYDGLSDALNQWLTWGLPYLIGRLYFGTLEGLRYFATAMVIGGLAYVLPCLFEIRMSPQIMNYIYGSFGGYQGIRLGGYRPYVFFRTGLELGLWMTAASMAGAWLWRCGAIKYLGSIPFGLILLPILLGTTIFCRSTGALLLLFTGLVVLWLSVRFRTRLFMVAIVLIAPLYVGVRVSKAWTGQQAVDLANLIEKERGESLAFRFDCENLLIERALMQPLFGWGGWNGSAVEVGGLDAHTGRPKTVTTDGLWIILLGTKGYFGLIGFYLVIAGPAMLFIRRFPPSQWGSPQVAAGSVAAMMLSLYTVDCLMNAFPNIIYMTLAGALAGLDPKQLRATGAGNVAGAARRTAGDSRRGAMAVPAAHGGPNMLADRYLRLGRSFRQEGSPDEADAAWRQALDMLTVLMEADPDVPGLRRQWCACANDLAWLRANHPDPGRRDPAGAVAMARRIVEECPDSQTYWNTLGVACYRAGDDASAVSALDRASALGGGTAFDDVFLALAHARLGELEAARLAFARASSHAERDHPGHPELAGFRDEARAILAEGTGSPAAAL